MEKLPEQILGTESDEEKIGRLAKEVKELKAQLEEAEKLNRKTKNALEAVGKKERLQRDSRQYRLFLAVFDGLSAAGELTPEKLARTGGMARIELLIKHSMAIAEHGAKYYREARMIMEASGHLEPEQEEAE